MIFVMANSGLAPWGQAAAIILSIYLLVSIILGLALAGALMFLLAWLRDKAELVNKLRPLVNQFNGALHAGQRDEPLPQEVADNKFLQVAAQVPKVVSTLPARSSAIEQKVEHASGRVAGAVIEFHARTEMVKGMARAFFLPGLGRAHPISVVPRQQLVEPERLEVEVQQVEIKKEPPRYEEEITIVQSSR